MPTPSTDVSDRGRWSITATSACRSRSRREAAEFFTKEMLDPYRVSGLDAVMADAIAVKLLPRR